MMVFEGGAQYGEPSERLRKRIQMELRAISRRVFAMQGHSLFLFFSNGEEIVRWVHGDAGENSEAGRE